MRNSEVCSSYEAQTHLSSSEFLLTLQPFILYVSHPEPQVCYFLVQALERRNKIIISQTNLWSMCGGEFFSTVRIPAKCINIIFRLMSLWRQYETFGPHRVKSQTRGTSHGNYYCKAAFILIHNSLFSCLTLI